MDSEVIVSEKKYYIRKEVNSIGYVSTMGGDPRLFHSYDDAERYITGRSDSDFWDILEYSFNILHLDAIEQLEDIGFSFDVQGDSLYVTLDSLMTGPIMNKLEWLTSSQLFLNRDCGIKANIQFVRTHSTIEQEILEYKWTITSH